MTPAGCTPSPTVSVTPDAMVSSAPFSTRSAETAVSCETVVSDEITATFPSADCPSTNAAVSAGTKPFSASYTRKLIASPVAPAPHEITEASMKPTSDVRPATRNFSVSPRAAMPSVSCKSRNPPSTRASDANVTAYEAAFPFVTLTCARSGPYASAPAETERAASAAATGCHSKRPVRRLSAPSVRNASAAVETSLPSASVSVAPGAETLL